jgi:hypothetical protein
VTARGHGRAQCIEKRDGNREANTKLKRLLADAMLTMRH